MMMISPKRHSGVPRILLACGVAFCMIAGALFARGVLEEGLLRTLAPILAWRNSFGASDLATQLASTTALVADRNALRAENLELKRLLGRSVGGGKVLAGVLQGPPGAPYDTLLLDAGSQHGVALGNIVAARGTTVVGTITSVQNTTARATLFSAPGEAYDALLNVGDKVVPLRVEGQGGGSLVAQVPVGTEVRVGDSVRLPGVEGGFIAEISAMQAQIGESFVTIYMRLPINPTSMQFVEVWTTNP